VIGREEANMGYNNFLYLLNDALKNNHIELALASLKTFRAADIADLLTQLSIEHSQLLLIHLPERAYIFSYLSPTQQVKFAKAIPRNILQKLLVKCRRINELMYSNV
jgi:magnesium transporter